MLCGWPLVCILLFVQLPLQSAAVWSLLAGYLLLPSGLSIDAHLLPPLDKFSIPALSTFLLCVMKGTSAPAPRRSFLIYLCALAFILSPLMTSLGNSYELRLADRSIPGFYPVDAVKLALQNVLTLAPFYSGLRYLSSDEGRRLLLRSLPIAAGFYSLLMLFEIRMSPNLHRMVYGFTSTTFGQQVRSGGGYRPVVFLFNGLEVALFTAMAVIAAIIAMRAKWRLFTLPAGVTATYLAALLLLCKTLGSVFYVMVAGPIALFTKPKTWVTISCVIVAIICAYPLLRNYDIVPLNRVSAAAGTISADRAGSFQVRVVNENKLLARANQKPYFGWGTWGRNRVYDEASGKDDSITDGAWIIRFGMFGWVGYLSLFGLFAVSIFSAREGVKGPVTTSSIMLGGLTLLLAVNLTDLIPNADLLPFTYVMAGSIAARARAPARLRQSRKAARTAVGEPSVATPG